MEITEIWSKVVLFVTSGLGGISLGAVISWIIAVVNSTRIKKALAEFHAQEIAELATNKGIEKIKTISYTHDIKPLVESELQKVYEYSIAMVNNELKNMESKYVQIINILNALSKYFDNSIGVSDEAKAELKEELTKAKDDAAIAEPIESTIVVEESVLPESNNEAKTVETTTKAKTTKVSR